MAGSSPTKLALARTSSIVVRSNFRQPKTPSEAWMAGESYFETDAEGNRTAGIASVINGHVLCFDFYYSDEVKLLSEEDCRSIKHIFVEEAR